MEYYLAHHGVKGQKWGVRRYQNPDGTLTREGKDHYHKNVSRQTRQAKIATGAMSSLIGGMYGAMPVAAAATFGIAPYAAIPISAAVGAGAAFVVNAKSTWKDIDFAADDAHMKIESGKYFMESRVKVDR